MNGATGTALEWALALLHAPAERHRLRQKPLPPGVGEVLAIAANVAPDELELAAARLRESTQTVREAARFYAREILFHADADAYRTLGVAEDASPEQIKAHFRLLQIWLHPDRQQSGDDSVFAARINQAWNLLRSEDRRRAYDLERSGHPSLEDPLRQGVQANADARPLVTGSWHPVQASAPVLGRRRHRVLVVALLGVCLLLGWLVVRQSEREPEPWKLETDGSAEAVAAVDPTVPQVTAAEPRHQPASHNAPVREAFASSAVAVAPVESPRHPALELPTSHDGEDSAALFPLPAKSSQRSGKADHAVASAPVRTAGSRVAVAPASPRAPVAGASVPPVSARALQRDSTPVAATPEIARPTANPNAATEQVARQEQPQAGRDTGIFSRLRRAFSRQQPDAPELGVSGDVDYDRIQQVRQVGSKLLQYLGSESSTPPPIWSNASTITLADGLRHDMHRAGAARLGSPRWRIGKTSASFESDYSVAGVNRGTLSVAIVWRENRWLVSSIALDTQP